MIDCKKCIKYSICIIPMDTGVKKINTCSGFKPKKKKKK